MGTNIWAVVGGSTFSLPMETLLGTTHQLLGMNIGATALQYKNAKFNSVTQQFFVPNGSSAAPSYSFEGDLESGMYLLAPNLIGWAINGVPAMLLSADNAILLGIDLALQNGIISEDFGSNIAAVAGTTDLANVNGNVVNITNAAGAKAITSLGGDVIPAGTEIETIFVITGGSLSLTNDPVGLILLGNSNINLQSEDVVRWRKISDSAPYWKMVGFQRGANTGLLTTKGDLLVGLGSGNTSRLGVGVPGSILMARPIETTGLAWAAALNKFISGFTYANSVGDVVNDIDIAAGGAMDSTSAYWITGTAKTKQLDAAWAVGTNAGGLDTGAIGNNDYYIHAIVRSDTGVVDYLFSLSSTAPTMPANYDFRRLIGWLKRVGGTIVLFDIYETEGGGIDFAWRQPTLEVNLAATLTTARRTDAMKVPLTFSVRARLGVFASDAAASFFLSVVCPDETDVAPDGTTNRLGSGFSSSTAGNNLWELDVRTSSAGLVASRASIATVDNYRISTHGFQWGRRNAL